MIQMQVLVVTNVVFLWIQPHQQHMHDLLLWDSASFWTQRLVLTQLLPKGPVALPTIPMLKLKSHRNQCFLFLPSNWNPIKACSSVDKCDLISLCCNLTNSFVAFRHWVVCQLKNAFHLSLSSQMWGSPVYNKFFDQWQFLRLLFFLCACSIHKGRFFL
jgi:hypothetical protein